MKSETSKKLAAQPAAKRSPRTLLFVGLPAFAVLAAIASQFSWSAPSSTAAPAAAPMRLQDVAVETTKDAAGDYKATKNPLVFVRNVPAPASSASKDKGMIYLKPGVRAADFANSRRSAPIRAVETKSTSPAGGYSLKLDPSSFPYAQAEIARDGKVTVKCVDPKHPAAITQTSVTSVKNQTR